MSTDATARVIAAVRDGDGGELFPPIAEERGGWLRRIRVLRGAADAQSLERALRDERFLPLRQLLRRLAISCEQWQARLPWVQQGILQISNAKLFGALVSDAYTACAMASGANAASAAQIVRKLRDGFVSAMQRFVERLRRDLQGGVLGESRQVVALVAHLAETHNGRQFAVEVRMASGAAWMYKPRPADGEQTMFGIFQRLNALQAAAGQPRLPVLRVLRGRGDDGDWYSWHEWVAPPRARELAPVAEGLRELRELRLPPQRAARFWYGAGCLAAASFIFGATDLFGENVRIGRTAGDGELRPYPIDLEMIGYPLRRLVETGLISGEAAPHPALAARLTAHSHRADDGPLVFFREPRGKALQLMHRARPWQRPHAAELVNGGYAEHLPSLLRGLFDQWVTLSQRKAELRAFLDELPEPRVRVVVRPTAEYARVLDAALLGHGGKRDPRDPRRATSLRWSKQERAQLARLDVPYFLRTASGPLGELSLPALAFREVGEQPFTVPYRQPVALAQRLEGATLAMLGVAMRDVVTCAGEPRHPILDAKRGVLVKRGEVRVRWREAQREVRLRWRGTRVQVELVELRDGPAQPRLRQQLLRMDRLDSALRERFQNSGFTDRESERTMEQLVTRAVAWLGEVIAEHGWPGRSLVGERAAAAACRLVQHADRFPAFQRRCLPLVEAAAAEGEATPRQLAYLTDQVRLRAKQKQRYGTKFRRLRGQLVPFPIEDEAGVDERRRQMGLEPLADYAQKLRRTFDAPQPALEENR